MCKKCFERDYILQRMDIIRDKQKTEWEFQTKFFDFTMNR